MKSLLLILILFVIFLYLLGNNNNIEYYQNLHVDKKILINLPDTDEGKLRWEIIQNHPFYKKNLSRFIGVNGNKTDLKKYFKNNYVTKYWNIGLWKGENNDRIIPMSNGEIGCILSHVLLWQYLVNNKNINKVMVLEDDAISVSTDIYDRINDIWRNVPDDWDIILIGFWLFKGLPPTKVNKYIYKVKDFFLTHSYIINKKGAKKLLKLLPANAPLDTWISMHTDKVNIYCHSFFTNELSQKPRGRLIRQKRNEKQILNTNNW